MVSSIFELGYDIVSIFILIINCAFKMVHNENSKHDIKELLPRNINISQHLILSPFAVTVQHWIGIESNNKFKQYLKSIIRHVCTQYYF